MLSKVSSQSNFLFKPIERRDTYLAALVAVVATAALGAMAVGLLSILANLGPMVGWSSTYSFAVLTGGGVTLSSLLVVAAISLLRSSQPKKGSIEEWKAKFPKNALRRLAKKKPADKQSPLTLNAEEKDLLEAKFPYIFNTTTTTRGGNRAEENGIHLYASGDHTVFEIEGIDGVIFKFSDSEEAQFYVDLRDEARRICLEEQLYLIQIPACNFVELSDGRQVIIERKIPNLQGNTAFQQELYEWGWGQPSLKPYFHELFSQLLIFICKSDFGDCKYNNIPLSIDGFLGLIDLDNWGAGAGLLRSFAGGKFNKGFSNEGLFNYLPEELVEEFIFKANELLGDQWLADFIKGHQPGDQWLDKLARKALGADLDNPEKIKVVVQKLKESPEVLTRIIRQLPAESELIREIAKTILNCPSFMTASIDRKAAEIKANPQEALKGFFESSEGALGKFGILFLVEQKVAEIKRKPELILDMVRARAQKRARRQAEFDAYLDAGGPKALREFEAAAQTISRLKARGEIDSTLDPKRIYKTARLIMDQSKAVQEDQITPFSGKEIVDLSFQDMWDGGGKHMSIYTKRRSFVHKGGKSLQTNVDPALKLLVEERCIFRYKYEHSRAGSNGSQYVTIEL